MPQYTPKKEQEMPSENTCFVADYRMFRTLTLNCFCGSAHMDKYLHFTSHRAGTVLSPASGAHGHSQLKCQNLRVGMYMENVLKWFNYPHARAHLGCEVSYHETEWTCIVGSSVIC